jgi:hypothetical protein
VLRNTDATRPSEARRDRQRELVRQFGAQRGCAALFRPSALARGELRRRLAALRAVPARRCGVRTPHYGGPGFSFRQLRS